MSEYDDIPGTYVFDGRRSREGYHLNMFCMSLIKEENRKRFATDQAGYLDKFPMSAGQRRAVLDRNWLEMLRLGGNIYRLQRSRDRVLTRGDPDVRARRGRVVCPRG